MRAGLLLAPVLALGACGSSAPGTPIDASVDTSVPPDTQACGTRGGASGLSRRAMKVARLHRTYLVYLPASADPGTGVPLVFVHHGFTMSGQLMHDITDYAALADREQIALAFPDGQGGPSTTNPPWNVGTDLCPSFLGPPPTARGDDFALLDAIKADISEDQCVDREHVFVTGFSMGGYFSNHAGCMRTDIRGIAPHSGGTHDLAGCANARMPVIIFHGAADPLIPAGCNDPGAPAVPGVTPAAAAWAQHNGCSTTTTTRSVPGGSCLRYEGCPAGGQVEMCSFIGMGHCWAGGAASQGVYSCPAYGDATQLAWQFFKQYAW